MREPCLKSKATHWISPLFWLWIWHKTHDVDTQENTINDTTAQWNSLKDMGKYIIRIHKDNVNKTQQNKAQQTATIFYGMYYMTVVWGTW